MLNDIMTAPVALTVIEILAAFCGVLGTIVLALRGPRAGWGFVVYLGSNVGWLTSSAIKGEWPLFVQTLAFLVSSLIGIWVWLVAPWLEKRVGRLCGFDR